MTVCNMSIEWGARAGMIAPDDTTFAYLEGREHAPAGRGLGARGRGLALARRAIPDAAYDTARRRSTSASSSRRSRGARTPAWSSRSRARCPTRRRSTTRTTGSRPSARSRTWTSAPGKRIEDIRVDRVFIGSCTNSRIEDLRAAAAIVAGHRVDPRVKALVVPGLGARCAARPRRRASTACSSTPASSGASPAARCASA